MGSSIDRTSPVPLWFQLAMSLERQIDSGMWSAGDQLTSEPELARAHGVSRSTVRQALRRLEQAGLVQRTKGQGTFVRPARLQSWLLQSVEGFFGDEVDRLGRRVDSQLLRREIGPMPGWATDLLELPTDSVGVNVERLRSVDGLIALYVEEHLPPALASAVLEMDAERDSLYTVLKKATGYQVAGARRVLQAVIAGDRLAGLLEVEAKDALVMVESVAWDARMQSFHCFRSWLRTDRMRIEIQATPARGLVDPSTDVSTGIGAWQ